MRRKSGQFETDPGQSTVGPWTSALPAFQPAYPATDRRGDLLYIYERIQCVRVFLVTPARGILLGTHGERRLYAEGGGAEL